MTRLRTLLAVILSILVSTACSISTEELTKQVRANMETKFTPQGITIKSLVLTKKAGNEYAGILETEEPNGTFTYTVEVISDGKNMTWQVK